MENFPSDSDLRNLVKELAQGRDLAKQLRLHLNAQSSSSSSSSSHETREFLLQRIVHSYDQALSILTHAHPPPAAGEAPPPADSPPRSLAGSPHSDDSDQDFKDQASRKRNKEVARWSEKIQVRPEAGIEGQLDDGYSWRKYGQKDILGAKHPRGYYRCTYRHSQGCLAAKQVQKSDDDPTVFEITYRRKHTCNPRARAPNTNNAPNHDQDPNPLTQQQNPPQNEPFFSIQTSLRLVSTQAQDENNPSISSSSSSYSFHPLLNFPSASSSTININNNNNNNNPQNNQLPFSYYNPISTNDMNDDYGGLIPNLNNSSDSELTPIVAPITSSTTNSATDFPFATSSGFTSNFGFGNPGYYP